MTLALAAPAAAPRGFAALAALHLALLGAFLAWGAVETRLLNGEPVWEKPAKFALALAVTFATLALVQARLSPAVAEGRLLRATAAVMGALALGEIAYIAFQAARGEASHFNESDALHAGIYAAMGIAAVVLTAGIGVVGWAAWRDGGAALSPGLRAAVGWGLMVTVPLTVAIALRLGGNGSHFVGGAPLPGSATVPFAGWSLTTGDLRPAHFLALHTMQAVPLWVLGREALGGRVSRPEVAAVLLLWVALALWQFSRALAGLPPV